MKLVVTIIFVVVMLSGAGAQPVLIQRDNGVVKANYTFSKYGIEETVVLPVDGPCRILEAQVYYRGKAGTDTLCFAADPSEGTLPPTSFVWGYSLLIPPKYVTYSGTPGWVTIDLRGDSLHAEGFDRISIQHRVLEMGRGPTFAYDNNGIGATYTSFYMNPYESFFPPNYGIAGKIYATLGDYMVRLLVEYDFPNGNTSDPPPPPTFVDVTAQAGIVGANQALIRTDRASVADWNGDGWDDIAIGATLFQNRGDGTFANVSATAGIQAGATAWADFDNDGRLDVFAANSWGADKLYKNNGDGTFTDVTATSKIFNNAPTQTPVWFDYNGDGRPDLFIANSRKEENGVETYYQDQLWRNDGNGVFSNVTQSCGIANVERAPYQDCYGASAVDYNNDGLTDIFVANYRLAPDYLYRNNGNGTFTDMGAISGVRGVPTQDPNYFGHGMGCEWGDFNNDGWMDLAVGNLAHPSDSRGLVSNPSLIFRNGGGTSPKFTETHQAMGLKFKEMNAGMCWGDFDLDGNLDLWHGQISYYDEGTNGEPERTGRLYFNHGAPDYRLEDVTWFAGIAMHGPWTAQRLDFDRDGDLDLLICSSHEGVKLFRNDVPRKGDWLELRLVGSPADGVAMDAFGAKVAVYAGARAFYRERAGSAAGSRATQHSATLHFGLGFAPAIDSVVVTWPDRSRRVLTGLAVNRMHTIGYDGSVTTRVDAAGSAPGSWTVDAAGIAGRVLRFRLDADKPVESLDIALYSALGACVGRWTLRDARPGTTYRNLPSDLAPGMYLVSFTSAGMRRVVKVARAGN